jgi:hypothetical protein
MSAIPSSSSAVKDTQSGPGVASATLNASVANLAVSHKAMVNEPPANTRKKTLQKGVGIQPVSLDASLAGKAVAPAVAAAAKNSSHTASLQGGRAGMAMDNIPVAIHRADEGAVVEHGSRTAVVTAAPTAAAAAITVEAKDVEPANRPVRQNSPATIDAVVAAAAAATAAAGHSTHTAIAQAGSRTDIGMKTSDLP